MSASDDSHTPVLTATASLTAGPAPPPSAGATAEPPLTPSAYYSTINYIHTVSLEIIVNTESLEQSPRDYIFKHLAKSDCLRGNKTRIPLTRYK